MILPILSYGNSILKKKCVDIDSSYPNLNELISDMWDTMYNAEGVGLAAPQIGRQIKLFIIDASPFFEEKEVTDYELKNLKRVFINPTVTFLNDEKCSFNEGCLSIPDIREDIERFDSIKIDFFDEEFNSHSLDFNGILSRVILHEYDHIQGVLFTDKISKFKRTLIQKKLNKISRGQIDVNYPMKFSKQLKT
tara:strand:- start:291 stop:869 length:579 start_codon:yes stop_codon:yes gene_type:complete